MAALLVCGLAVAGAFLIRDTELRSRRRLEARFQVRAELAEIFLRSFVTDLLRRERRVAEKTLAGREIAQPEIDRVVEAFGLEAAVVTDARGNLVAVYPLRPEIIGTNVASRYEHLRLALANGSAVSPVVRSAAEGTPIVAFATRFRNASGWAVFSGAWDLSQAPLRAFLDNLVPIPGSSANLVDRDGSVIASNRFQHDLTELRAMESSPRLPQLRTRTVSREGRRIVVAPVAETPWRLVVCLSAKRSSTLLSKAGVVGCPRCFWRD